MAQHPLNSGSTGSHELRMPLICAASAIQMMQHLNIRKTSAESRIAIAAILREMQIFLKQDMNLVHLADPQVPGNADPTKWGEYIHQWILFTNGILRPQFLASIEELQRSNRRAFRELQALLQFDWPTRKIGTAIIPRNFLQPEKKRGE